MTDPLFWLVLSLLFVTVSLTIVLAVAIPALRELARAARSAEKLFDTLRREFPPTLEAIRLTGMEISDLTDDVSEGVQSAGSVVKQVDQSLTGVRSQAQRVQSTTRTTFVGLKAAWRTLTRPQKPPQRRSIDRLPPPRPDTELDSTLSSLDRSPNRRAFPEEIPLEHVEVDPVKPSSNHLERFNGTSAFDPEELEYESFSESDEAFENATNSAYRYRGDDREPLSDEPTQKPNRG